MPQVKPVPDGHGPLVPHLVVRNAARAIDFYKVAFGAEEEFRLVEPDGKVGHAELRFGSALFALADEYPDFGALAPPTVGGSPVKLLLYVEDADAALVRAEAAGATIVRPIRNEFYGDRTATVADPFGYQWQLSSRVEALAPAEMQERWNRMMTAGP